MSYRLRVGLTAAGVLVLANVVSAQTASIGKYAADEFFAACYLRPHELAADAVLNTLPISALVPARCSPERLKAIGVDELVLLAGPSAADWRGRRNQDAPRFQLAAAARLAQPVQLDALLTQWRASSVLPPSNAAIKAEPFSLEGRECFRVPAGTFLNSPRIYGQLRFTDREGQATEKGINVGRIYEDRGYVEGGTKGTAIFTFTRLSEADLIDGRLPLEMRLDVFLTQQLPREFSRGQIVLRNPDSHLRSEPFPFEARSYVNRQFTIPRKLAAVDAAGNARQVDLLEDLVSDGELEVVLQGRDPSAYLGVGKYDMNVRPDAAEYVFVAGPELVVAQSPGTLRSMLLARRNSGPLAQRLAQSEGEAALLASVRDPSQRQALNQLVHAISGSQFLALSGVSVVSVTARWKSSDPRIGRIKVELADKGSADRLRAAVHRGLQSVRQTATDRIEGIVAGNDVLGSLLTLVFDGASLRFPELDLPPREMRKQLHLIVEQLLTHVEVETQDATLTVDVTRPRILARLPRSGRFALARLEEELAKDLCHRERFDAGAEMYRRVTDRLPAFPEVWFRRAHHLSYNMSVEFDGYQTRYSWVRRGVEALLDGAERNPDTVDLVWMTGKFIGHKVGMADERSQYRRLFSEDRQLHQRLAWLVSIDKARSPDGRIDNWLVAQALFQDCVDRHARFGTPSRIPAVALFAQPAAAQAHDAQSLDEAGHGNDAAQAWAKAERMYRQLGERTITSPASIPIKLNDARRRLAELDPDDPQAKAYRAALLWGQYEYWLARCQLEQAGELRQARRLAGEAERRFRQSDLRESFALYERSLQTLAKQLDQRPAPMKAIADDFRHIMEGYRRAAQELGEQEDDSLKPLLQVIEDAQPRSPFSLLGNDVFSDGER